MASSSIREMTDFKIQQGHNISPLKGPVRGLRIHNLF